MPQVLSAGRRDQQVSFQSYTEGALDANGRPAKSWSTQGTAWVRMQFLGGAEADIGGAIKYMPTYKVDMLKLDAASITPKWRMLRGSEVYHVLSKDETDFGNAAIVLIVARDESAGAA